VTDESAAIAWQCSKQITPGGFLPDRGDPLFNCQFAELMGSASRAVGWVSLGSRATFSVAAALMADVTVAGVAVGCACKCKVATPVTCGVAMDVPLMVLVAVVLVYQAEVKLEPGAHSCNGLVR